MSTTLTAAAALVSSLTGVPGAGEILTATQYQAALQALLNMDAYLLAATLATKGASTPVIMGDGITTAGTEYELVTEGGARYLRLKRHVLFDRAARAIAAADSEFGWTWANRARIVAGDEDTTAADACYLEHDGAASAYDSAVTSGPFRYRTYKNGVYTFDLTARVVQSGTNDGDHVGIVISNPTTPTKLMRLIIGYQGGSPTVSCQDSAGGGFSVVIAAGAVNTDGTWLRIVRLGTSFVVLYSVTNQATPPSDWTVLYTSIDQAHFQQGFPTSFRAGITLNGSGTAAFNATVLYYDDRATYTQDLDGVQETWGAQGYASTGPEIQILDDWDLGAAAPALSQASVRAALGDAVNRLPGDAGAWTFSVKQSATVGATSGAFAAASALTISGTGRYVSVWAKCTSTNNVQAGSLLLPISLPFTP